MIVYAVFSNFSAFQPILFNTLETCVPFRWYSSISVVCSSLHLQWGLVMNFVFPKKHHVWWIPCTDMLFVVLRNCEEAWQSSGSCEVLRGSTAWIKILCGFIRVLKSLKLTCKGQTPTSLPTFRNRHCVKEINKIHYYNRTEEGIKCNWINPLTPELTIILLMWNVRWIPNDAGKWQMGFNSAFEGLSPSAQRLPDEILYWGLCF
jgi:hypothetical protein